MVLLLAEELGAHIFFLHPPDLRPTHESPDQLYIIGFVVLKGKIRHSFQCGELPINRAVFGVCFLPVEDVTLNSVRIELTSETVAEYGLEMLPATLDVRKGLPAVDPVVALEQWVEIGDQKLLTFRFINS
jgi:hypothetical protein